MKWNPDDYAKHSDAQLKWARGLRQALNLKGDEAILDVGCGDGKITADFSTAVPNGLVMGIDSASEMIAYAQKTYPQSQYPTLSFACQDARQLKVGQDFDLCFSNAVLHWVDDHPAFLSGASQALKPGGRLVISCGGEGNAAEILDVFAEVVTRPQWQSLFSTFENPYFFYGPEQYNQWLQTNGFEVKRLELVPKDMTHQGQTGLEAWIRTTWMPFTEQVPLEQQEDFISEIVTTYLDRVPIDDQGLTHVKMVRLEVEAVKV